jgi:hypothetical protein
MYILEYRDSICDSSFVQPAAIRYTDSATAACVNDIIYIDVTISTIFINSF